MKAFAGLVIGLVVAGCPLETAAGAVEVIVTIDKACNPTVGSTKAVSRLKRDILVWSFASACTDAQVWVCPKQGNPLDCMGDPPSAKIGAPFRIDGGADKTPAHATVACKVDWGVITGNTSRKFKFQVVSGSPNGGTLACPKDRASELELDVKP